VTCTLADSYISYSASAAGAAAELAANRKSGKYADLPASYIFQPVAMETLGPISCTAVDFLRELGRKISTQSNDERESLFLFQRLSVLLQRYNAVLLHDSFVVDVDPDL
jgi:hypothetical protein